MGQLKVETARRPGIEQFSQMELLGYRLFLPSPKTKYTESHPKFMGSRGSKGDVEGPFNRNEEEKKSSPNPPPPNLERSRHPNHAQFRVGFSYHGVLVIDLDDDDGGVIPHLVSFPVQLHVVKHQELVPGRAQGLVENLEKWERFLLLQEQIRILGKGGR